MIDLASASCHSSGILNCQSRQIQIPPEPCPKATNQSRFPLLPSSLSTTLHHTLHSPPYKDTRTNALLSPNRIPPALKMSITAFMFLCSNHFQPRVLSFLSAYSNPICAPRPSPRSLLNIGWESVPSSNNDQALPLC